jgi:inosine-uridine nucleoside N-ribohydrolase
VPSPSTSAQPTPVYLDCDTGIDASLALSHLASNPAVQLVGVGTVSGNTTAERAAINSIDLLATDGRGQLIAGLRGQRLGSTDDPTARTRVVLATDRPLGPHLLDTISPVRVHQRTF